MKFLNTVFDQLEPNENLSKAEDQPQNSLRWYFWFLVAFSAFLIVTFGLYIPLRFQHQSLGREEMEEVMVPHMEMKEEMHEAHDSAQYHEEGEIRSGPVVNLNVTPAPFKIGAPLRFDFFVNRKPENIPIVNLEFDHEKLMHVVGVRSDLNEFFHIHPELTETPGFLSINRVFSKPGPYKLWSEIKVDGINHVFGHPELSVEGSGEPLRKKVDFGRNFIVGEYQVALRLGESVRARKQVSVLFDIHTVDSREAELENYLGAPMHLTLIRDDWQQFMHTHPEGIVKHSHASATLLPTALANGGGHNTAEGGHGVSFKVTFPEPGLYKAFAQFRPRGIDLPPDEALLAEFWIKAEEEARLGLSPWWFNLLWASAATLFLSWIVIRYLRIK